MPLSDIDVNRVLTSEEVHEIEMLECYEFDQHIKQVKKRWQALLSASSWEKNTPIPDDRVVVKAWKEGSVFKFKPENRACTFFPELSIHCWLAKKPRATGLCVGDLEDIVCKMELENTIKVLLEAGFVLEVVVYKFNVVL